MTKDEVTGQAAQPPFTKVPIAAIDRILRVSLVLFPVLVLSGAKYWELFQDGELLRYGWGPLVFLLPTIGLSYHVWAMTERKIYTGQWETIPIKERFNNIKESSTLILLLILVACGIAWLYQYNSGSFSEDWSNIWPVFLLLMVPIAHFVVLQRKYVLTEAAQRAKSADDEEKRGRPSLWKNPWVRYALAILLCGMAQAIDIELDIKIANHEIGEKDLATSRLSIGLFIFIAAYFAKELVLITLPFVLTWHIFTMLPTFDRVLLIAIIIAAIGYYFEQNERKRLLELENMARKRAESGFMPYTGKKESGEY
jgi:hypothetical protein